MAPRVRTLIEHLMRWYSPDEQANRARTTNDVIDHANEAMARGTKAVDRANIMVESYQRAQENYLCRH
jgi:hypothetical protein